MRDLEPTNSEIIINSSKSIYLDSSTKMVNITCSKAGDYFDGSISVFINKVKIEAKCDNYKGVIFEDFYCVSKSIEYDTSNLNSFDDFINFDCLAEKKPELTINVKLFKLGKSIL